MAYNATEDDRGRQVRPLVGNESEDGTGTWHALVTDSSGYLKTKLQYIADDVLLKIGTDSDIVILNRSATLSADEELTDVIEGTSTHPATAANTLIISNITDDGDILMLGSDGGHSRAFLFFDASTPDLYLYKVGGTWTAGATTWTIPAFTLGGGALNMNGLPINDAGYITCINGTHVNWSGPNSAHVLAIIARRPNASAGEALTLRTYNASDTATTRLSLTGGVDTAVATWSNITHTGFDITSGQTLKVGGTQVVSAQGAAVADPTDAASTQARLTDLLGRLRTHGLIAT